MYLVLNLFNLKILLMEFYLAIRVEIVIVFVSYSLFPIPFPIPHPIKTRCIIAAYFYNSL